MKINRDKIISEFSLSSFGAKGWLRSSKLPCPFCGKSDKFGVILNESAISSFHCFHASCGQKGSLFELFRKINRLDLLDFEVDIDIRQKLTSFLEDLQEEIVEPTEVLLPTGFTEISEHPYLNFRRWEKEDILNARVGISNFSSRLRDYLIFPLIEDSRVVGWLARSQRSKEWHKENLKKVKLGEAQLRLRYDNSPGVDFENLLGGIDDVNLGDRVILVEGIMDRVGVRQYIRYNDIKSTSCCYTCGTNVTLPQIFKLLKKGVKHVILMYDFNTIKKVQEYALLLTNYFPIVEIAEIRDEGKDPGNMFDEDFDLVLSSLKSPSYYKLNRLSSSPLKI